jgi:hypothetical protein
MRRSRLPHSTRMIVGLLIGLLTILTLPLTAQPASETHASVRGFGPVYDAAHEVTLSGTIQKVVTKHTVGSPVGLYLLVEGSRGLVDAHVGPFLSKETKDALHTGTPVQIVGANVSLHGKTYLFARELNVGGSTITVRSKRGALAHEHSNREHVARGKATSHTEANGGAR